jgi:predicted O-methyltransferase YrrM
MFINATVAEVVDRVDRLRLEVNDTWQVPRVEGELLHHLALSMKAKLIVEIGTSYGFSSLFWADAMARTGGHVHTIDIDRKKFAASREHFRAAGLDGYVTNHLGNATELVSTLPDGIDLAFLDADKSQTQQYLDAVWPKLRVGGSALIDNATTHREQLAPYLRALRARDDTSVIEVAVGNGLIWAIKTAPGSSA